MEANSFPGLLAGMNSTISGSSSNPFFSGGQVEGQQEVRAMKVCTTMEGSKMATRAWGREVYNWIPKQSSSLPLPMSREPCREGCCRIRSENAMLETNLYTTHFRGRKI